MASFVSEQDKPNPALWLANWEGKMGLSCHLGITLCVSQENSFFYITGKSIIVQDGCILSSSFFACLLTSTPSWPTITRSGTWPISNHFGLKLTWSGTPIYWLQVTDCLQDTASISVYDILKATNFYFCCCCFWDWCFGGPFWCHIFFVRHIPNVKGTFGI